MTSGLLIIALIVGAILFPGPARALDEPMEYSEHAIAPPVMRQGEFAVHLAEALALEFAQDDEDDAARVLAALAIEPPEGWSRDQILTPQTVLELRADVADAAAAGRLAMAPDAVLTAFNELLAELSLPLPAESAPAYAGGSTPVDGYGPYCDARSLHHYYGSVGLPYYTYCYPPSVYFHHYSWVPYGFLAHGHHFAGFFVLKQVKVIPRVRIVHRRLHSDHRFADGRRKHDHKHHHKNERRVGRAVPTPGPDHRMPAARVWLRDVATDVLRIKPNVMEHKSKIVQRHVPGVPPLADPPARTHRDSRIHRGTAPRPLVAPFAPRAAAPPARRHAGHGITPWSKHAAPSTPMATPSVVPSRQHVRQGALRIQR